MRNLRKNLGNGSPVLQPCSALVQGQGQFESVGSGLKLECGKAGLGPNCFAPCEYPQMISKWKDSPKSSASSLRVKICCASVSPDPKQGKAKLLCFCKVQEWLLLRQI